MNDAPIKEIAFGPKNDYIKAAIWENQSQQGHTYYSTKISRHYRDDEGWNETQTLFVNHLPLARLANEKAFEFIHEKMAVQQSKKTDESKAEDTEKSTPAKKRARRKTHAQKIDDERKSNSVAK